MASGTSSQSDSGAPRMVKIAEIPDGEETKLADILDKSYSTVFKGCDSGTPLLSVAITGRMRSGKSFLMNLFATYIEYLSNQDGNDDGWESSNMKIEGIVWSSGLGSVTQGIWMWDQPLFIKREDGTKVAVVLIDIQGLGDSARADDEIDNLLMYIGLQICNVQIINLKSNLIHDDFSKLSNCAVYSEINDEEKGLYGNLIFLTRDLTLANLYGEHKEEFSNLHKGARQPQIKETMERIRNSFAAITSFYFPSPSEKVMTADENDKNLKICGADVGEEFLRNCKLLFQYILSIDIPEERKVTIRDAVRLFEGLQERIAGHENGLPNTGTQAVDIAVNRIYLKAQTYYDDALKETEELSPDQVVSEEELSRRLERVKQSTLDVYSSKCTLKDEKSNYSAHYKKYQGYLERYISEGNEKLVCAYKEITLRKQADEANRIAGEEKKRAAEAEQTAKEAQLKADEEKRRATEAEHQALIAHEKEDQANRVAAAEKKKAAEAEQAAKEAQWKADEEKKRAAEAEQAAAEARNLADKEKKKAEDAEHTATVAQRKADEEKEKTAKAEHQIKEEKQKTDEARANALEAKSELQSARVKFSSLEEELKNIRAEKDKESTENATKIQHLEKEATKLVSENTRLQDEVRTLNTKCQEQSNTLTKVKVLRNQCRKHHDSSIVTRHLTISKRFLDQLDEVL